MTRHGRALGLVVLMLAPAAAKAENATFSLIVNAGNPISTLTRMQASRLLLKKVTRWENGKAVEPADLAEGAPAREALSHALHRRGTAAIKSYWQQQIFSGTDVPPPEFASDAEVVAYVKMRPGGIGYVSSLPTESGVKVVRLLP